MCRKRDKTGDAVSRPRRGSSLLGHPGAKLSVKTQYTHKTRKKVEFNGQFDTSTNGRLVTTEARETNNDKKRRRNNTINDKSSTLIDVKGPRYDCNPSVAALRLYSHGRNDHSHRAGIDHSHRRNSQGALVAFRVPSTLHLTAGKLLALAESSSCLFSCCPGVPIGPTTLERQRT